jgi:riboflavin synthase
MFTGIVEATGIVVDVKKSLGNLEMYLKSPFTDELRIDQSLAHNGVCLTVDEIKDSVFRVTAIQETLQKTNLGNLKVGDSVNLERCMRLGDRLDGHMVQGHVDHAVRCISVKEEKGSHVFEFECKPSGSNILVMKGSVCLNGVSLTISALEEESFSVSIIPYTYMHTNFNNLRVHDEVNIEYDVFGKYISAYLSRQKGF